MRLLKYQHSENELFSLIALQNEFRRQFYEFSFSATHGSLHTLWLSRSGSCSPRISKLCISFTSVLTCRSVDRLTPFCIRKFMSLNAYLYCTNLLYVVLASTLYKTGYAFATTTCRLDVIVNLR
jgi:hypothetical protein